MNTGDKPILSTKGLLTTIAWSSKLGIKYALEGSVFVGGKDVRDYDMEVLRDNVAVVLQKNVLFSGTILDNLRWGNPNATEEQCRQACIQACADDFIEAFPDGYNTIIEQGGVNVSGGQRQRICIARALYRLGDTPDGLGRKTLEAYANDPRRAFAQHAKLVLGR